MTRRVLEPMDWVGSRGIDAIIVPQTVGRSLMMKPAARPQGKDRVYFRSEDFWEDVLSEKLGAERLVTLDNMRLFEWFPRNPGLFHTEEAQWARAEAENHIRHIEERDFEAFRSNADAPPDHAALIRTVTGGGGPTRTQIFTPKGKLSMLQGGIGCVRLQPALLDDGSRAGFMSATSSTSPDEGIPLLVTDSLYQTNIDRIKESGFATVRLRGRTRFIEERFTDFYTVRAGIPRLYVEIEEIEDAGPDVDYGLVSVAASFVAEIEGQTSIYAAYVTFDPGFEGARANAARWMREEYVQGYYKGEVLTDFDQQRPTISNTLFSLNEVLTSPDLAAAIRRLRDLRGYFDWDMLNEGTFNFNTHQEFVRMKVEANNNSGAMIIGDNNSANQLTVNRADLVRLGNELERLVENLRKEPPSDQRDRAVGALLDAKESATDGNAAMTTSALQRLKPIGRKIVDIGEKIGVGLAVAAIKSAVAM
jgi:hypothetical protein